jgi:hypothetical protein
VQPVHGRPPDISMSSACRGPKVCDTTTTYRVNQSFSTWENLTQTSTSTEVGNQGPSLYSNNPASVNVYMMKGNDFISTRAHDYSKPSTSEKGKEVEIPSLPLHIEKTLGETMTHIPKGASKKYSHNPNARAVQNYYVMEDSSQTPCAMSTLEVLQS